MSLQPPPKRVQWQSAVTRYWWQTVPHRRPVSGETALTYLLITLKASHMTYYICVAISDALTPTLLPTTICISWGFQKYGWVVRSRSRSSDSIQTARYSCVQRPEVDHPSWRHCCKCSVTSALSETVKAGWSSDQRPAALLHTEP